MEQTIQKECKERFQLLEGGLNKMELIIKEISAKLDQHGQNIKELREEFKVLIELIKETNANSIRIDNLEKRVNELKRTLDKLIVWVITYSIVTFAGLFIQHFR